MRVTSLLVVVLAGLATMLPLSQAWTNWALRAPRSEAVAASPADKVKVEFFVMSKCPDAATCESTFAPALYALSPILDLSFDYIATRGSSVTVGNISCMHGESECQGNRQQLCAQLLSSAQSQSLQYLNFTTCQSATYRTVPDNADACALQAGLDAKKLQSCVASVGQQLLYDSVTYARQRSQSVSCSILVNDAPWCQRDGSWKGCTEGDDASSLVTAVCKRYKGSDKPAVCNQAAQPADSTVETSTETTAGDVAVPRKRQPFSRFKL